MAEEKRKKGEKTKKQNIAHMDPKLGKRVSMSPLSVTEPDRIWCEYTSKGFGDDTARRGLHEELTSA